MLKVSKQGDYGLVIMLSLASDFSTGQWIALKDIADQRNLSPLFLSKIIRRLKKASLVESKEGSGGGYRLSRDPQSITVREVLAALLGEVEPTACTAGKTCVSSLQCPALPVWERIQQKVREVLDNTTLQELIPPQRLQP